MYGISAQTHPHSNMDPAFSQILTRRAVEHFQQIHLIVNARIKLIMDYLENVLKASIQPCHRALEKEAAVALRR